MGWRYRGYKKRRRFHRVKKGFRRVRKAVRIATLPLRAGIKFAKIVKAAWHAKHGPTA